MSALIGVFWRASRGEAAGRAALEALKEGIRSSVETAASSEIGLQNCRLLKTDFGAYGSSGIVRDGNAVVAVCGHPYLDHLKSDARSSHVEFLATAAEAGLPAALAQARGSFSLAGVLPGGTRLALATDCLGVRPLYYADDGEIVVFSSTLAPFGRLSESLIGRRDERAAVERAVLGFPLGDRTGWTGVRCVPPGCVLLFTEAGVEHVQYWSMSAAPTVHEGSRHESLHEIYETFSDAVALRARGSTAATAMLSGGMDSRAIVAALRSLDIAVDSLNFSPPGSQDSIYGARIAAALESRHTEVPTNGYDVLDNLCSALERLPPPDGRNERTTTRRNPIWSGDGGSVTLGHVYLTEEMIESAEAGGDPRTIDLMQSRLFWTVPRRLLRSDRASELMSYPQDGLLEALRAQQHPDPGRRLHMMLMATDQRRHLHPHFERIYEHRCELELPFFDRRFVEAIVARPVRPFLYHRFYNRWFELFAPEVMSVPWQAYPGHEPCPVAASEQLEYQWTDEALLPTHRVERRRYLGRTARALMAGEFSRTAISARRLAIAWTATAFGIRDLTYALRFAALLAER